MAWPTDCKSHRLPRILISVEKEEIVSFILLYRGLFVMIARTHPFENGKVRLDNVDTDGGDNGE